MLVFILLYSVIFCFACFASQTSCLCNALPSAPVVCSCLLYAFVVTNLCFVLFASPTSGLCIAFPFGSPQVYILYFFLCLLFSLLLLCVLCPTSSGLCSDFFPGPLEFARFIFCFVLYSVLIFVFCVLSLTNLIFLRFQ